MSGMTALYLVTTLLVMTSFGAVDAQDELAEKRLETIRRVSKIIQRRLDRIERKNYGCNGTVYDVIETMDNVSYQVEDLYHGPCLAKFDLTDGRSGCDRVLLKVPDPVEECLDSYKNTRISKKQARIRCIQQVIWKIQYPDYKSEKSYRIMAQYNPYVPNLKARGKGKKPPKKYPKTTSGSMQTTTPYDKGQLSMSTSTSAVFSVFSSSGSSPTPVILRVRKEYRTLTLTERTRFHNALNVLYNNGVVAAFAETHRRATRGAHRGPAFLPWHRVFITRFENALQLVDPSVTLPYWDSTMDDCLPNPALSTMWSDDFVGNGAGIVVTGPFAGWTAGDWFLERTYAQRGNLVRRINLDRVLTRCTYDQITVPTGVRRFRIESFHNGVHIWVGGDMNSVRSAPYDPVFYMHHCFIDYIWEKFRERQIFCGEDPETDYIAASGAHNYNSPMAQQTDYLVSDGMSNFWTDEVYTYAETPTCENNCQDSDHLYCDPILNCCVPLQRYPNGGTTTSTTTTAEPFGRKRRNVDMENYDNDGRRGRSNGTCNKYLDPECTNRRAMAYGRARGQLPIGLEKEIIDNLVVKNRGELFTPGSSDTTRTLNTVEKDKRMYDAFRKARVAEEAMVARELGIPPRRGRVNVGSS